MAKSHGDSYGKITLINGLNQMVRLHLHPHVTWSHFEHRTNETLGTNPHREVGSNQVPPNQKRDIHYPIFNDNARDSLQMMTVMDMNLNNLISDEIVLRDHVYRLEQHGNNFYLAEVGKKNFIYSGSYFK